MASFLGIVRLICGVVLIIVCFPSETHKLMGFVGIGLVVSAFWTFLRSAQGEEVHDDLDKRISSLGDNKKEEDQ